MTQKQKDLLFKDLCARLPYGVKGCFQDSNDELLRSVTITYGNLKPNGMVMTGDIKPYLFPLSSMTEEQYKKWCDLAEEPLDEILARNANGIKMTTLEHHLLVAKGMVDPLQWCYENHFDVNGFIPKGWAKDATGLNIY